MVKLAVPHSQWLLDVPIMSIESHPGKSHWIMQRFGPETISLLRLVIHNLILIGSQTLFSILSALPTVAHHCPDSPCITLERMTLYLPTIRPLVDNLRTRGILLI